MWSIPIKIHAVYGNNVSEKSGGLFYTTERGLLTSCSRCIVPAVELQHKIVDSIYQILV